MEAPWIPAALVPGSNPTARAAEARAKASNGWGGSVYREGGVLMALEGALALKHS